MKVKIIESLANGVPVLCSPEAADGLPADIRAKLTISTTITPELLDRAATLTLSDTAQALYPFSTSAFEANVLKIWDRFKTCHGV